MWRLRLTTLRALIILCAFPACALAQSARQPTAANSSGGSVLRQVSGVVGVVPLVDEPAELYASDEFGLSDAVEGRWADGMNGGDGPHWTDPYHVDFTKSHDESPSAMPWDGIVPSLHGPRTPQQFRHRGLGKPLMGTSWNNRPLSAGWFAGIVDGAPLSMAEIDQGVGFFGGIRAGWDYDYYWGLETRLAGAKVPIIDFARNPVSRNADLVVWDIDLLYYPWGDSLWRPYFMLGLGLSVSQFDDLFGHRVSQGMFALPFGGGLKYQWNDHIVARIDLVDNLAFGAGEVDTLNNLSLTFGMDFRFGGVRKLYWPWYPGRHIW